MDRYEAALVDPATGAQVFNPAHALTAYPVEVEGDRLFVLA